MSNIEINVRNKTFMLVFLIRFGDFSLDFTVPYIKLKISSQNYFYYIFLNILLQNNS